jgi:hypothetical protein
MKLIKHKEGYSLCIEENAFNSREFIATTDGMYVKHRLSKQNCDEIFGVVDVNSEVETIVKTICPDDRGKDVIYGTGMAVGIQCFNKAMELNKDKLFTVEDMRQAYDNGMDNIDADGCAIDNPDEDFFDTLRCIQQPKEIEVEIVTHVDLAATPTDSRHPDAYLGTDTGIPFLDENGCLILKKK